MSYIKMTDLDLHGKRVLIREDFNVPLQKGRVASDARIKAALFTIESVLAQKAQVILMSHLGRPVEGQYDAACSLQPVAECLSALLKYPVLLQKNWLDGFDIPEHSIVLCENVRFCVGEKKNDDVLAKKMAQLADVFVMDAFGVAHRRHASTFGVAHYAPIACAGPLLVAELEALSTALAKPARPVVTIVGGSKVSTKLGVLESVVGLSDHLIVGGGIANTFLAARGFPVGQSLYEPDFVPQAQAMLDKYGDKIPLPVDVVTAQNIAPSAQGHIKKVTEVAAEDKILDIGPDSQQRYARILQNAATIIWNGPVGMFELPAFAAGTKAIAEAIARNAGFSIAGGGDTLAAIEQFAIRDKVSYISTGGGAFLEWLEGKTLPAVAILEQRGVLRAYD